MEKTNQRAKAKGRWKQGRGEIYHQLLSRNIKKLLHIQAEKSHR